MRPVTGLLACLTGAAFVLWATSRAAAAPGDVKQSFPAPCKYPSGLASDGTHLYLLDWRDAKLFQISPSSGETIRTWSAPTLMPHGLACGGGLLYISDDHSGRVLVFDPRTGVVEHAFEAPGSQPTGLAYASGVLFVLERKTRQIYRVLPEDGTILAYIPMPTGSSSGLAYDGKYLWVSDRVNNELYMVDPETGMVIGILPAPGPCAAGLAWHAGHLWNVDFQTRRLYQLVVRDRQKYRLSDPREARVEYQWTLYNYGPGDVIDLTVSIALAEPLPGLELLSDIEYSAPPSHSAADRWGQRCALFEFDRVPAGSRQRVGYSLRVRASAIDYLILPDETGALEDIPDELREAYTADGTRLRITSPYIRETARQIVAQEENPYWMARRIYNFVIDKLEYEMVGGWDLPEVVLKRGRGSCSEYTFAFVALCRAAGLPARYCGSVVVRGDDASIDEAFHRWAEVYLPGYGWVPVDANRGDKKEPADQARGFGHLTNHFFITTRGGGDSEYLGWGYNSLAAYKTTGYCKVEEENLGFWEPAPQEERPSETQAQPRSGAAP